MVYLYRVSKREPNGTLINDFWQRGSLFNYLVIMGEKFDIGREPCVCSFHRNSSTIADDS